MLSMSVRDILEATGASRVAGPCDGVVRSVTLDSRQAAEGVAFVAFAGERVDGNAFASEALARAATVVLTGPAPKGCAEAAERHGCALLRAEGDDGEEFLLRLAGAWRRLNPQWTVVGVTGSVGKTTTKDMLAAGLRARFRVHATAGNFNNLIGLPLTLLSADPSDEVVVAEMGMNHAGELSRLAACARPTVALITNVGTSHIGLLGSRESIARAKAEIVGGMRPSSSAQGAVRPCLALTSDNDFAALIEDEYAAPAGVEVLHVGGRPCDDVRAVGIALDDGGLPRFELSFADGWSEPCTLGMPGRHVVSDVLLAMAICDRLGVDRHDALDRIARMPQTHMRLEVVTAPGRPRMIDDSYNASPSSVAAALDVLCSMACTGRRVAVLGEIGELGDEAPRLHGYIGAYAAAKPLDLLVLVGTHDAAAMAEAALTMGFSEDRMERVDDVQAALDLIAPVLGEDDLVLAKASRASGLDRFVKGVLA